jgi:hypothetical protein
MVSPQIKILITIASISVIYAFVCKIQLARYAGKLMSIIRKQHPDLWSTLNSFARNYDGGYPGLKLLYRKNAADLSMFDQKYEQLRSLERKLLWGVGTCSVCIGLIIVGIKFWSWHW